MCATCGCGRDGTAVITEPHEHDHPPGGDHDHDHVHDDGHAHTHADGDGHDHVHSDGHTHDHDPPGTATLILEQRVLAKNDELAQRNRQWFADHEILALNLTSSPGAGKTTLLERTIRERPEIPIEVVEGDQETLLDARRIESAGSRVVQINTGAGCHLDAEMTHRALDALNPADRSVVLIENVGNLVCPALFDLGEQAKVVIISVTEGTNKPLKYPHMFAAAGLVLINKIDLLPYVDFDVDACARYARATNPDVEVLALSATTGEGLAQWYDWLDARRRARLDQAIEVTFPQA
ncbi:hydrogenase nickel incorporation protein HypB [Nocardia miyunensis]|uniref:hydrogenase nickel incorporation protein HypB n=1 Tax=Nocardia miyunensis TaxID=282684 RepID=UPI00082A46F5|nr:hydrogenase nickel incorporation protein HypB [Nocardia miyunensis]